MKIRKLRPASAGERYEVERATRSHNAFPWTDELVALLGAHPDRIVAERLGVSLATVVAERHRRGIAASQPRRGPIEWTPEMIAVLGTDSDSRVATTLGVPRRSVRNKRALLGIPPYHPPPHEAIQGHVWSTGELALLGKVSDADVGEAVGLSVSTVCRKRQRLGVPPFRPQAPLVDWTEREVASLLGTVADAEVAQSLDVTESTVLKHRHRQGIPASREGRAVAINEDLVEVLRLPSSEVRRRTGLRYETIRRLREKLEITAPNAFEWRWPAAMLARLGKEPDARIAADLGLTTRGVAAKRRRLRIPPFRPTSRRWTAEELALLGTAPDAEVAARTGRSLHAVRLKRRRLGRRRGPKPRPWLAEEVALLGTAPDAEIAQRIGRSIESVRQERRKVRTASRRA